jgi:hypothetical protein
LKYFLLIHPCSSQPWKASTNTFHLQSQVLAAGQNGFAVDRFLPAYLHDTSVQPATTTIPMALLHVLIRLDVPGHHIFGHSLLPEVSQSAGLAPTVSTSAITAPEGGNPNYGAAGIGSGQVTTTQYKQTTTYTPAAQQGVTFLPMPQQQQDSMVAPQLMDPYYAQQQLQQAQQQQQHNMQKQAPTGVIPAQQTSTTYVNAF